MSPKSIMGVVLCLMTLAIVSVPLLQRLHYVDLESSQPAVQQATAPPEGQRSTVEQYFDSEGMRLQLERHTKAP